MSHSHLPQSNHRFAQALERDLIRLYSFAFGPRPAHRCWQTNHGGRVR